MKRWSWLMAIALSVSMLGFAGCEDDDDDDEGTTTTTTTTGGTTTGGTTTGGTTTGDTTPAEPDNANVAGDWNGPQNYPGGTAHFNVSLTQDADDVVRIWTAQRRYLGRLRRHPSYTEVKSGTHGGTEWAEFTIPASEWNPATGAKRKVTMTDEQRAASAARLRAVRASA